MLAGRASVASPFRWLIGSGWMLGIVNLPESIDPNVRVDLHCSEAKLVVEYEGCSALYG